MISGSYLLLRFRDGKFLHTRHLSDANADFVPFVRRNFSDAAQGGGSGFIANELQQHAIDMPFREGQRDCPVLGTVDSPTLIRQQGFVVTPIAPVPFLALFS